MKRSLAILCLLIASPLLLIAQDEKPVVHVFVPSNVRPHAMQELLDRACGEKLDVQVYGRISEFRHQVRSEQDPPDAVITLGPVMKELPGMEKTFTLKLEGHRNVNGKQEKTEKMVLLSVKDPIDLKKIDNPSFGVVNLLGRRLIQQYVAQNLKEEGAVFEEKNLRIRSVSKLEDLLSLLQFQNVVAILVPESKIEYYQSRSRLKLVRTDLEQFQISLPVLAVRDPNSATAELIKNQIQQMDDDGKSVLGVDEWLDP
jgi:hypothetical protein